MSSKIHESVTSAHARVVRKKYCFLLVHRSIKSIEENDDAEYDEDDIRLHPARLKFPEEQSEKSREIRGEVHQPIDNVLIE